MKKKSLVMFFCFCFCFFFKRLCPCEVVTEVGASAVLFVAEGDVSPIKKKKIPKFLPENNFLRNFSSHSSTLYSDRGPAIVSDEIIETATCG